MTYEANGVEVTKSAFELYERILKGVRLQVADPTEDSVGYSAAYELMTLGLIETQALVWETRVCYVLTGADPRRDAVARVLDDAVGMEANLSPDRLAEIADRILAVLR